MAKGLVGDADALILDLEDSVAPEAKGRAAQCVAAFVGGIALGRVGRPEIWVRVNAGDQAIVDIAAMAAPGITGFCLAKVSGAAHVEAASESCRVAEARLGLTRGIIGLMPLLETGSAVVEAVSIARASTRILALQVGEADLCADLGVDPQAEGRELLHVRSHVVLASAAAGVGQPIAPVSTDFSDLVSFRDGTRDLTRLGYRGRACIHPRQVAVVNEVMRPTDDERDAATRLIADFDKALESGHGVARDASGRMIDAAVAKQARRTLAYDQETQRREDS
jgi:citrate lyase subunit beta / citryl-CoA lyase